MKLYKLNITSHAILMTLSISCMTLWHLNAGSKNVKRPPRFKIGQHAIKPAVPQNSAGLLQEPQQLYASTLQDEDQSYLQQGITSTFNDYRHNLKSKFSSQAEAQQFVQDAGIGSMLTAEAELNDIFEECLFKIDETKQHPFSYFVNKIIATIKKYWQTLRSKLSEQELKQLVQELENVKYNKNVLTVGQTLSKYKKLLPSTSLVHKTNIFALKNLLVARLAIP